MQQSKERYTWGSFDEDCAEIAEWARQKEIRNIYGLKRGGWIPAVRLSHLLDLPIIERPGEISDQTLVVDDIVDKEIVMRAMLTKLKIRPLIASLFWKKNSETKPDFFVRLKKRWVVFPWETEASSKYDNTQE